MSAWFLWAATLLYLGAAVSFIRERNYGMAVAFLAYALANVGLIVASKHG